MKGLFKPVHVFSDHSAAVYSIARGRSENTILSASGDRFIAEWDLAAQHPLPFAVNLGHPAYAVCYLPTYDLLLAGNSIGGIHVIQTSEKKELAYIVQHHHGIYDFLYDEQRNQVIVAGGDGNLSVWSIPSMELQIVIPITEGKIRQLAMSPDRNQFSAACGDGKVRIFEPVFFNEIFTLNGHEGSATSVAFHPTKPVLISGGRDAFLRFYRLQDGAEILDIPAHRFAIYSISFNPEGTICATTSRDKTIKLWTADTFDPLDKLDVTSGGHSHSVNRLLWADNQTFVSCGDDRKIIIWKKEQSKHP